MPRSKTGGGHACQVFTARIDCVVAGGGWRVAGGDGVGRHAGRREERRLVCTLEFDGAHSKSNQVVFRFPPALEYKYLGRPRVPVDYVTVVPVDDVSLIHFRNS